MTMWMIRSEGGKLFEDFRQHAVAAIGWPRLAALVNPAMTRRQVAELYKEIEPQLTSGSLIAGASQVWRFINEVAINDSVITYSPTNRTYLVGRVSGESKYHQEWADLGMPLARHVEWSAKEVERDVLTAPSRNSLGSTLTVFRVPDFAEQELLAQSGVGQLQPRDADDIPEESIVDPLAGIDSLAIERIKDLVSRLDWSDMQELIAGLLRAMGYKTQVSPAGADRGKDIIASPDGFGFEHPRIVVEVKHRKGQMDSQAIRSFLGGRHKDDRGLYVSTGGFTKDAHYEADRANIPLALWTLDHVVRALTEHYDETDSETKRLIPLKRFYIPA